MVRHRPAQPLVCLPLGALQDRRLSRVDLDVLAWLKSHDPFDNGTVAKSHVQIAGHLGHRTEGAAGVSVRRLVKAGWLEVIYAGRFGGGNRSGDANVYRFTWLEAVDNSEGSTRGSARESQPDPRVTIARGSARTTSPTEKGAGQRSRAAGRTDDNDCFHASLCGCTECEGIRHA